MSRKIQILRGELKDLPLLDVGELAWVMDAQKLFVGNGEENIDLTTVSIDTEELLKHEELSNLIRSMGVSLKPDVAKFSQLPTNDAESTVRYVTERNQSYIRKDGSWVPFAKVIGAEHLERLVAQQPINPNLLEKADTSKPENVEGWLPWPSSSTLTQHQGTKFFKIENKTGNNLGMSTTRTYDVVAGEQLVVSFYAALSNVNEIWGHMYWLDPSGLLTVENVDITDTGQRLEGLPVKRYVLKLAPSSTSSSNRRFLIGSWKQQRGELATMYISEPKLEHGITDTPFTLHQNDIYNKLDQLENSSDNPNLFTERFNIGWSTTPTHVGITSSSSYRYTLIDLEEGEYTLGMEEWASRTYVRIENSADIDRIDGTPKAEYWDLLPMTFKVKKSGRYIINIRRNDGSGLIPYGPNELTSGELGIKLERGRKKTPFTQPPTAINRLIKRDESGVKTVNVVDLGADPRGKMDSSAAFLEAAALMEELGGGVIEIPSGDFMVNEMITIPSNTTVAGKGNSTRLFNTNRNNLFRTMGTYEPEVTIAGSIRDSSQRRISVSSSSFSVGDDVLVLGQRNPLSTDAGDFQLGRWTGSNYTELYFGEFRTISKIDSKVFLELSSGLNYPGYNSNAGAEKEDNPRKATGIFKLNLTKNVTIRDFRVTGEFANVIRFYWSKDCVVENVIAEDGGNGGFIVFDKSWKCEARNCKSYCDYNTEPPTHYSRNKYKTISTYLCGFVGCQDQNGTQPVDFTYSTGWMCNSHSYFINGIIDNSTYNSATAHGGSYGAVFEGNTMTGCRRAGISSRSKASRITNNTIVGSGASSGSDYGIAVYETGSSDSLVSDNVITNFYTAVYFVDSDTAPFRYMGTMVMNNHITRIVNGIWFRRNSTIKHPTSLRANVIISGNYIRDFDASTSTSGKGISVQEYFHAVDFRDNVIINGAGSNAGIYCGGNCDDWSFSGNRLYGYVASGIWFVGLSDNTTFGSSAKARLWVDATNTQSQHRLSGRVDVMPMYTTGNLTPVEDNTYTVGTSSRRYNRIYSSNGVTTTSDRNLKENIETLDRGLNVVSKLKPKQYNLKGEPGTHYGVIAQDIEDLFNSMGVETKDLAMLDVDVDEDTGDKRYGLNYSELIPILVKSIQELQDEIRKIK